MPTAFVHDPLYELHDAGRNHPERPDRIRAALALLQEAPVFADLVPLTARDATREELALVHDAALIDLVREASRAGDSWLDPDTHAGTHSFDAAVRSAGGCLAAVDWVLDKAGRNAFALVRPPGHHATPTRAMGFCFFNNIAVAAAHALERRGLDRVAIVDLDVHHGNGTEDCFASDPRVLYVSTHQYPFYPGTGALEDTGLGEGRGSTINVPLPAGSGDVAYCEAMAQIVTPALQRFGPQLILVSVGFDAHFADPLAGMQLSNAGYAHMVASLCALSGELCEGRIVFALEGGYDLDAVAWGVLNTCEALAGLEPSPDPLGPAPPAPEPDIARLLQRAKALHRL
ncbi:MAG TPA: histone deacetylase [Dehalococcoidia bacterium]|nr:histone deacetylase [Dehalococcoidia bacterium]